MKGRVKESIAYQEVNRKQKVWIEAALGEGTEIYEIIKGLKRRINRLPAVAYQISLQMLQIRHAIDN